MPSTIRDQWVASGGRQWMGCPLANSQLLSDGAGQLTQFAGGDGYGPGTVIARSPHGVLTDVDGPLRYLWAAAGQERGFLGYPLGNGHGGGHGEVAYMNFQGGYIALSPIGPARVVRGGGYPALAPGALSTCVQRDRPCIAAVHAVRRTVRLSWLYGPADAFNVAWWLPDGTAGGAEVAGYDFVLNDARPGAEYGLRVEACNKHFLAHSTCSGWSGSVTVRVPAA
jgi:hypothetical protein